MGEEIARVCLPTRLQYVAGTTGARRLGQRSEPVVLIMLVARPAVDDLPESLAKVVAEESVEDRIDAAVRVGEHVARYLKHDRRRGERVELERLHHQYHLPIQS